jgi:CTP:molybdopterin cytidylyltransferase MocA
MGSPKALLEYRGETFLDRLIRLFAARCSPVIVTLGAHAEEVRKRASQPAFFVLNPDFERGQITSMQCGLRVLPPEAGAVLFTLVDHPAVSSETLTALTSRPGHRLVWPVKSEAPEPSGAGRGAHAFCGPTLWSADPRAPTTPPSPPPLLRVPRYRTRRGHPIWFSCDLVSEFLSLPETAAARDVVRLHADRTEFLDLDDPGIVADIDDPAAYAALAGALP